MTTDENNHAEWLDAFERNGFVVLRDLFDAELCGQLREATLRAIDTDWQRCRDLPGKQRFIAMDLTHLDPLFVQFLEHPGIVSVFDALLGPHWTLYSFTSTLLPAGDEKPYTCQIHNETNRIIEDYLTSALMTIALEDFTVDNGATLYYPGSHRIPERPDEATFHANAVPLERNAGDVVVFHPRVWHAGGHNTSGHDRVGCTIYACRPWMKQRFDFPRMLGDEVLDLVGDTGRRILGFNARLPTAMDEFYRPADQRLYHPGQG